MTENKGDLISREALKKQVKELLVLAVKRVDDTPTNSPCYRMYVEQENERARLIDLIDNAPTVERPQGEWKFLDHKYYDDRSRLLWAKFKCACCGEIRSFYEIPETIGEFDTDNFCSNCGADMRGKEE